MTKGIISPFKFTQFIVPKVQYDRIPGTLGELHMDLKPSGRFNRESRTFFLDIEVTITDSNDQIEIYCGYLGVFDCKEIKDENLEPYITSSAIGIIVPHIRAHISTFTMVSGLDIIMIPAVDVQSLAIHLKNNIKDHVRNPELEGDHTITQLKEMVEKEKNTTKAPKAKPRS